MSRPLAVLFADDNDDIRTIMAYYLKDAMGQRPFELVLAKNGLEADALLNERSFDVAFLDLSMPGMTGWRLAEKLVTQDRHRKLILVAVTAHAMPRDRVRATEVGFHHYLIKPLYAESLAELMEDIALPEPS